MFLVFLGLISYAQYSSEVDVSFGQVIKHREQLLFNQPSVAVGAGLYFQYHTNGSEAWHTYWKEPIIEGAINYLNFGDNKVLGSAISLAPGIAFRLKEWNKTSLQFHYGTGLAFLTKKFHKQNNPTNNAIGSTYNNTTRIKLSVNRSISDTWAMRIGASIVHYSNGLTSSPNRGLNVYSVNVGLIRKVKKQESKDFSHAPLNYRKLGLSMQTGIGLNEYGVSGGPNYPVYAISLGGYYRYSDFQRLHCGIEFEYSVSAAEFERATLRPEMAHAKARRTIIYLGNELMFGEIRFRFQAGYYTPYYSAYDGKPVYFKLQTSYHPTYLKIKELSPYIGVLLKTHNAIAEYISVNIGLDI